ncbi:hypothetical protein EI94DRAFT_1809453 [Lactarius quietus]|nr:hypothetical protein EI94DRAFT_1809453 [Lactarius quietus]
MNSPTARRSTTNFAYVPGGPIYKGTVNDPTTFPPPSKSHGSLVLRTPPRRGCLRYVSLSRATPRRAPQCQPHHAQPHWPQVPYLRPLLTWTLCATTLATGVGVYQSNTNDIGRLKHVHGWDSEAAYELHRRLLSNTLEPSRVLEPTIDTLLRLARAALGVNTHLRATVRDAHPALTVEGGPSVTLASGEVIHADLIIAADGVKSTIQKIVTGRDDNPTPTGDIAYLNAARPRALLVRRNAGDDRLDGPWASPHVALHCASTTWCCSTQATDPSSRGQSSDEKITDLPLTSKIKSTLKWHLMGRSSLPAWVHPKGRLALLGGSCHPILVAAMAVEDAAVLGDLSSLLTYLGFRLPRATTTQQSSRLDLKIFHLPDRPGPNSAEPEPVADREKNQNQFSYDTYCRVVGQRRA